jgi:hypothetical protein
MSRDSTSSPVPHLPRQRQHRRYRAERGELEHRLVLHRREVAPDGRETAEVGVEQRPAEDTEGQAGQFADHVDRAVPAGGAQPVDQHDRLVRHDARLSGDAAVREGRLHDAALLAPKGALAGQEAVAERPPGVHEPDALVVVGGVVGEDVLGVLRVIEEVQGLGPDRQFRRVAEPVGRGHHHAEPVPAHGQQHPPGGRPGGSRRRGGPAGACGGGGHGPTAAGIPASRRN